MRELATKAGSLVLGIGALGLLLVNAAFTHGCGGTRATGGVPAAAPSSPDAAAEQHDPCAPDPYMYATKAPIFVPPNCRGEGQAAQQAAEPQIDNAQAR